MSESLVKIEHAETAIDRPGPRDTVRMATEEANVLSEVIERQRLFSLIQGKRFVKVEGWVTLATLRGCLPREVAVHEMPEGRYVAEVELVRMSDGFVLTKASAECGGPEDTVWAKRPPNARRSMAITRATGKACRVPFSWVMALAGFEPTPAEEMDHVAQPQESENPAPRPEPVRREWPAPGAPKPSEGAPVWRGKFASVDVKEGVSSKTKKPYKLWKFHGQDGQVFGTFSESIGSALVKLDGRVLEVVFSTTANGDQVIEEFRDVTLEEAPF